MANFGKCQLHIPHKSWVQDSNLDVATGERLERENWNGLERWANEVLPDCVGCSCFYEHKHFNEIGVPLNIYTVLAPSSTFTVGSRVGWDDARTTLLVTNWTVNISDYSDGTTPGSVQYGYGCIVDQQGNFIGGSHGFINLGGGLGWPADIFGSIGFPAGVTEDQLTSGSFTSFLNGPQPGPFPARWDFNLGVYLGIDNPDPLAFAGFSADTYEYGLCSCDAQE